MFNLRIEKEVRNGGITEGGLTLLDKDGEQYHWITKQYNHPLFFSLSGEWYKVTMTLSKGHWGQNIVKNVRVVK